MCDGAMRDALSILDQAISMGEGKVEYSGVVTMLGLVSNENLLKLTESIIEKDVESSMRTIDDIVFSGKDIYTFIRDMITHMRNLLMVKVSQSPEEILDMSEENVNFVKDQAQKIRVEEIMRNIRILQDAEEQSKWTKQSRIYLELAVIKMCKIEYDTSKEVILSRLNRLEEALKDGEIKVSCERIISKVANKEAKQKSESTIKNETLIRESIHAVKEENIYSKVSLDIVKKSWRDILEAFKARRQMVLFAALTTGEVIKCENGIIIIQYRKDYAFHKQRLEKEENRKLVEDVFSDLLKERLKIQYIIDGEEVKVLNDSPEQLLRAAFGEDLVEIIDE